MVLDILLILLASQELLYYRSVSVTRNTTSVLNKMTSRCFLHPTDNKAFIGVISHFGQKDALDLSIRSSTLRRDVLALDRMEPLILGSCSVRDFMPVTYVQPMRG